MNVAYLLVGTAWLAGDPTPASHPAPTQVVVQTSHSSGNCGCNAGCSTDPCCDSSFGSKLRDRIRGLFSRNDDCGCNPCATVTCNTPAPCCAPAPVHHAPSCNNCCDPCAERSFGGRLLDKIRGLFRRNDDCGCSSCGTPSCCGSATIGHPVPMPGVKGEAIPAPQGPAKMPEGGKGAAGNGFQINVAPAQPIPAQPIPSATPALQQVPSVVPGIVPPAPPIPAPGRTLSNGPGRPF